MRDPSTHHSTCCLHPSTYRFRLNLFHRKAKLPACFSREYGMEVAPLVMFRDPSRNEFEVMIEKKNGKAYFTDGWATMKDFYIITACSWMTVIYANRNLFLFRGVTRKEREFLYPRFSPPKRFLLKHMSPSSAGNTTIPNALAFLFFQRNFTTPFRNS